MHTLVATLTAIFALTACASSGPVGYGPANGGKFGYTDTQIEKGRFRVVYRGSGGTPPETVESLALQRAAELTLDEGYDWFNVVDRSIDGEERGGVSLGAGVGSGRIGRRSGVGIGVGGDLGTIGARAFYTARLEVLMGNNPQPDEENMYDARSVLSSISGALQTE